MQSLQQHLHIPILEMNHTLSLSYSFQFHKVVQLFQIEFVDDACQFECSYIFLKSSDQKDCVSVNGMVGLSLYKHMGRRSLHINRSLYYYCYLIASWLSNQENLINAASILSLHCLLLQHSSQLVHDDYLQVQERITFCCGVVYFASLQLLRQGRVSIYKCYPFNMCLLKNYNIWTYCSYSPHNHKTFAVTSVLCWISRG
eukprot:TRINITY_DN9762_c0_g2_i1.p1 TRINITY_DN9762_c0_g2~~TRINITY_DN9762_c0_g2_i1.p1  ORF type:complete len:200 (-),score=-19.73 TRINITY_DN9762_c0_g2_i1:198-797(-)